MDKSFVVNVQLIMQKAKNYNNWLYELVKPFLRGTSLEIGGGIGNLTQIILSAPGVQRHVVVDIDARCLSLHRQHILNAYSREASKIKFVCGDFNKVNLKECSFDVIICLNVLEHIENDQKAVRQMYKLLNPNGHLVLFVPAFKLLYGEIDRKLKHFRRYNKSKLLNLLKEEKFNVIKIRYYNMLGFLGWFVNFTIFKKKSQSFNQVIFFDKYIFTIQSYFEKFTPWQPIGQSLFAVVRK